MRTKRSILSCFILVIMLLSLVPMTAGSSDHTVDEVKSLVDGIIAYKTDKAGCGSVQEWIDTDLASGAGKRSEWYVISLRQYGYTELSGYEAALNEYIGSHNVTSATSREKYALALCACGSKSGYISDILDDSIGDMGIMSLIYGLHILNNGYTCSEHSPDSIVDELLSLQYDDGGWALFGDYGDIDVTAMTLSALAPYCGDSEVDAACDRAIDFLSERQEPDGGYQSFGTKNPESSAQVLVALSSLGIDCCSDSRFIKNGNTIIDGIEKFRLSDGSFCHVEGGAQNESATFQALYSFIAYIRMSEGKTRLFVFDKNEMPAHGEEAPSQHTHEEDTQSSGDDEHDDTVPSAETAPSGETKKPAVSSTSATSSGQTVTTSTSTNTASSKASGSKPGSKSSTAGSTITTSVTAATAAQLSSPEKGGYKPVAIIIIAATAGLVSLVIFALGKRNYKNFIFVGIIAAAGVAAVLMTDIRSKDEYYSGVKQHKENAIGTVTMTIRCDNIVGKSDSEFIPDDGIILDVTNFEIEDGDTVFDILNEAAQTYSIHVENTGSASNAHGMVYIAAINHIYEFEFGDLSGWVYHVNGVSPSRGCGDYVLSDGDRIEWLYTCELGHDLDEVYEK